MNRLKNLGLDYYIRNVLKVSFTSRVHSSKLNKVEGLHVHKLLTRADLPVDARILRLFAGSRRREARESVPRGRGKT